MQERWNVEDWINEIASMPIRQFYPTAVAKATELPLDIVFEILLDAVNAGKLNLLWEVRCSNLECVRTIRLDPERATSGYLSCPTCGEDIEISPDIVYPVFEVTPDYKERTKEKKTPKPLAKCAMARQ
jgi:hypothetical protein